MDDIQAKVGPNYYTSKSLFPYSAFRILGEIEAQEFGESLYELVDIHNQVLEYIYINKM